MNFDKYLTVICWVNLSYWYTNEYNQGNGVVPYDLPGTHFSYIDKLGFGHG